MQVEEEELIEYKRGHGYNQGLKPKPKPEPEKPVLKEILDTQTETDPYLAKFLKT